MNAMKTILALALGSVLWTEGASAALVTVAFKGTINNVSSDAAGLISIGDSYSGVYTFDPNTPDTDPSPISGEYTNAIKDLSINVGGYTFSKGVDPSSNSQTDSIEVVNNGFGMNVDLYAVSVFALVGDAIGPYPAGQFRFNSLILSDGTGTAFSSDALPAVAPTLSSFQNDNPLSGTVVELERCYSGTCQTFVSAQLTSLTPVPEPDTYAMLLVGLTLICGVAIRRKPVVA